MAAPFTRPRDNLSPVCVSLLSGVAVCVAGLPTKALVKHLRLRLEILAPPAGGGGGYSYQLVCGGQLAADDEFIAGRRDFVGVVRHAAAERLPASVVARCVEAWEFLDDARAGSLPRTTLSGLMRAVGLDGTDAATRACGGLSPTVIFPQFLTAVADSREEALRSADPGDFLPDLAEDGPPLARRGASLERRVSELGLPRDVLTAQSELRPLRQLDYSLNTLEARKLGVHPYDREPLLEFELMLLTGALCCTLLCCC